MATEPFSGTVTVELGLNGNSHSVVSWTDVSDIVMSAHWQRGRTERKQPWHPRLAEVALDDPSRDFDPLNTLGAHAGTLHKGRKIRITVTHPDSGATQRIWYGRITKFEPRVYGDDTQVVTVIKAIDDLSYLNVKMPLFTNDYCRNRLEKARAGVYYTYDTPNSGAAGRIEDMSGKGGDGVAYTDETVPTIGITSVVPSTISMFGVSSVVVPTPDDIIRNSREGILFVALIKWTGEPSPSGSYEYATIFSEGIDGAGGGSDGINLHLRETRTGGLTAGTNPVRLRCYIHDNNTQIFVGNVGVGTTRDDWLNRERVVILAIDQSYLTLACAVHNGDGTLAGGTSMSNNFLLSSMGLAGLGGSTPPAITAPRRTKIGHDTLTPNIRGFDGQMDVGALAFAGAPTEFIAQMLADTVSRGFIRANGVDRAQDIVSALGIPLGTWAFNITSGIRYNDYEPVGDQVALTLMQRIVANEQGRLYQSYQGIITLEDFAQAKANSATVVATYTDQASGLNLKAAHIEPDMHEVVNRAVGRLPTGHTEEFSDATSITEHGDSPASYNLSFQAYTVAANFVEFMVDRYKDCGAGIDHVIIDPQTNEAAWWPILIDSEIGDRIQIDRQPGKVGSVINADMVLEGDEWFYNASTGIEVHQFFARADPWMAPHVFP